VSQSRFRNLTLSGAVLCAVLVTIGLSACGAGAGANPNPPEAARPDAVMIQDLQGGDLELKALLDGSASRYSPPIVRQSMATVRNAFELTLAHGGSFSAELIRGDLATVPLVQAASVPAAGSSSSEIERSEIAAALRSELEAATEALAKDPHVRQTREGSAIAYNLHEALANLEISGSRGQPVVVLVTDGVDDSVKGHLGESPQHLAARIASRLGSGGAEGSDIIIAGVGTGVRGAPAGAATRLASAWRLACQRTGAHCSVSIEVESPALLEAFEDA
jgi:hypothetical protein